MTRSLEGRNAIITGASRGLGLEIARSYVRAGASVLLCARDRDRLAQVRAGLSAEASSDQRIEAERADVSSREDVERFVERALQAFGDVHILVNNAGIYGPMGRIEDIDWHAWTRAIEINLYGPILMCRAMIPHFRARRYGKVIQLSGGGATNPLPRLSAYAASKAAIVRLTETLAEEVREDGIDVNAIAPGALNTQLLDEVLAAGPERVGAAFYERAVKQKREGGASLARAAELAVFLGSALSDGITGKLLSAPWDPWETLPQRHAELQGDLYTLRRIAPRDRGLDWG